MQNELLVVYENRLLEKENSGVRVLLKDDKVFLQLEFFFYFIISVRFKHWYLIPQYGQVADLSRMYKLYSKVPQGLEPIGMIFKKVSSFSSTSLEKTLFVMACLFLNNA